VERRKEKMWICPKFWLPVRKSVKRLINYDWGERQPIQSKFKRMDQRKSCSRNLPWLSPIWAVVKSERLWIWIHHSWMGQARRCLQTLWLDCENSFSSANQSCLKTWRNLCGWKSVTQVCHMRGEKNFGAWILCPAPLPRPYWANVQSEDWVCVAVINLYSLFNIACTIYSSPCITLSHKSI
jgi:hypothetical protein